MHKWQTISGGTLWALLATLMISAALQPVEVSAATVKEEAHVVSLCDDGSPALVMGCASIHL